MSEGISWQVAARVERFSKDQTDWAQARVRRGIGFRLCRFRTQHSRLLLAGALRLTGVPELGYGHAPGNIAVTQGLNQITQLLIGSGGTALSNTHGIAGVGNGTLPAPAIGDVQLIADGTANALYQGFDATFPQQSNGVITGQSTFATTAAVFNWNEWCWAASTGTVGASSSTILHTAAGSGGWAAATSQFMWNHRVPPTSLGNKPSGTAWIFVVTLTLA